MPIVEQSHPSQEDETDPELSEGDLPIISLMQIMIMRMRVLPIISSMQMLMLIMILHPIISFDADHDYDDYDESAHDENNDDLK